MIWPPLKKVKSPEAQKMRGLCERMRRAVMFIRADKSLRGGGQMYRWIIIECGSRRSYAVHESERASEGESECSPLLLYSASSEHSVRMMMRSSPDGKRRTGGGSSQSARRSIRF